MTQWQTQLDQLRKDHRAPLAITALLGLFLLLAIWQLISTFIANPLKISTNKTAIIAVQPLQNLSDLHLFGMHATNVESIPTTTLQFTLEGTIVFVDAPAQSRALIAEPNTPAKVYKIGDTLPGNATITRIAKYFVVFNDNGTLEKLTLPIPPLLKASDGDK